MEDPNRQPGLKRRIDREAKRISSQHRQLDVFYGMVVASLLRGNAKRARSEFLRLHDALEAHFTVEERMHFPALHGLRPELDDELAALVEEHKVFRKTLQSIAATLQQGDLDAGGDALDRFVVELAAHEGREEQMAERVTHGKR